MFHADDNARACAEGSALIREYARSHDLDVVHSPEFLYLLPDADELTAARQRCSEAGLDVEESPHNRWLEVEGCRGEPGCVGRRIQCGGRLDVDADRRLRAQRHHHQTASMGE